MSVDACLNAGELLGNRILKVDHAGEHGAVNIYRAQIAVSRMLWPQLVPELAEFKSHEERHRALFWQLMATRGVARCRSYLFCGLGGFLLGSITGLLGPKAIAATTHAVESVVLGHLEAQMATLRDTDPDAYDAVSNIVSEERQHHAQAQRHFVAGEFWPRVLTPLVRASTEAVIWLGMRL